MGQKAFDILPPYPKEEPRTYHHHTTAKVKKEKVKSRHAFLIFMFGLFFIMILFGLVKLENFKGSSLINSASAPTASENSNTDNNQFELFNNQGQSSLTDTSQTVSVRLLDGTTKTENVSNVKSLLLKNSYLIEKQDKADNLYSQTMIYYKKGKISLAQKASESLKPNFNPVLQESSGLSATYDLLIIVGDK